MKLKKVRLQAFRNHSDSIIDIGNATFVVIKGDNFAGKSSIGQGISMGLTPSTSGLDAQGRGYARKIKRGETKSVITLDVQGGTHLVQKTVTLNTNQSGRTQKCVCLDDPDWKPLPFDTFLDRFKDALMVTLNTDYFVLRMGEKEQKKLLAQLALPERYDFPDDKIKEIERLLGEGAIDFSGEPFAVIDKAYKKLFDERQIVNRQVKEFNIPELLPIDPSVDSVGLENEIEKLKHAQRLLRADRDRAVEASGELEQKRTKLQTTIDNLRKDVQGRKEKLDEIEKQILSPAKVSEFQKIADRKPQYDKLVQEQHFNLGCIHTKDQELARLEMLPDAGTTCPTCDQVIDAERLKKMNADLVVEREKYITRNPEIMRELKELGDVEGAITAIATHTHKVKEKSEITQELSAKVQTGKKTREQLDALEPASDPRETFVQPLADIDRQIDEATNKLRPVIAAEERKKEVAQRTKILDGLKANAAALDELVKYFDKDGIKAKLLAEYIGGFENKVNEVTEAWGYKCSLSIDPYEFLVTNSRGDTIPVSELSGGEELMFSLALQCAVSRATGINMIVADKMDTFLPEQRLKANMCLYKMTKSGMLEQVIMIVADTDKNIQQARPEFAFFYVTDGSVERLVHQG